MLKNSIKAFLKKFNIEIKKNVPIERIIESDIYDTFTDSKGNIFNLISGYRSYIVPHWKNMCNSKLREPDSLTIKNTIIQAKNAVDKMIKTLALHDFNIKNKKILEIGCFDGSKTAVISQYANEVCGSDISQYYLTQQNNDINQENSSKQNQILNNIRNKYTDYLNIKENKIKFVEDSICSSLLPANEFDLICSWEVLEHIANPKDMFKEMRRILKPGGIAFHEYNPFFCLQGGHSLCTLDFPWGHVRLNADDFKNYISKIRPQEFNLAMGFYKDNLNRLCISELKKLCKDNYFEVLSCITWSSDEHIKILNKQILDQATDIYPDIDILDLITPMIWLIIKKLK